MKQLGYYAKNKKGDLFRFEWSTDDKFSIIRGDGSVQTQDPNDYEVLEIGHFDADSKLTNKRLTLSQYHTLRNQIWGDLCAKGLFQDDNDEEFKAFDEVLGGRIAIDFS